jgi:N-acetylglucosaminyl-diphospho-decaprenol L-rhamnosyltransferase
MLLSIIIVSFEVRYFLEQCLFSVKAAASHLGETEIIVIDNASTDGSIDYLRDRFPSIRFISNDKNIGFGRANNLGLQQARGEFVLFLNPDTIIPENILKDCISFFQSQSSTGAIGVRMIDGQGKFLVESKRGFPTTWRSLCKLSGLTALFPASKTFAGYNLGHRSETGIFPVDALAGAFLMARKEVLDKIGGFDERFFMYAEDIDLSKRIKDAGFENYYLGNRTILHFKGESTTRDRRYVRMFYQAMSLYVQKYYSGLGSRISVGVMNAGIALRSMIAGAGIKRGREVERIPGEVNLIGDQLEIVSIRKSLKRIKENPAAEILVICEGPGFSFQSIIDIMQKLPREREALIHAAGSHSVVGSFDRGKQGLAMHMSAL